MSLIPEKRVDRNGRLVTKHVRNTPVRPSQAFIPAPVATPAPKLKKVPVARTKPVLWDLYKSQCGADKELEAVSYSLTPHLITYYFHASDVEAYSVMSRVAPENIIPLLACGIKTGDEAVAFLKSNNLEHLIKDNVSMAEQALAQNIPAQVFREFTHSYPEDTADNPSYFDAIAVFGVKTFRESGHYPRLPELVLSGKINSDDLKALGPKRIKAGRAGSAIVGQLEKINNGLSKMTSKELGEIIDKALEDGAGNPAIVNETVWLADRHGPELALKLKQPVLAAQLDQQLTSIQYDQSGIEAILIWHDELRYGTLLGHVPHQQIKELFEAGVKPEDAAAGLTEKLSTQQIIGIHANSVPKAVSGGWL